jgi:SAM-dependent methyltransferase
MAVDHVSDAAPAPQRDSAERFDPETMSGGLVEAEHWARYRWAVPWVADKDVLDAGCGVGYGTRILGGGKPRRLVGVDIAPEALESAHVESAEFIQADVHQLPFEADSFDLAVCFEVIEHVYGHEQVLDELRRVVRPGGTLLISSPNREVYAPGNPHHVYEFVPDELRDALASDFENVTLFGQHVFLASTIARAEQLRSGVTGACEVGVMAAVTPGRETYTLAVASDQPVPELERLIALADGFELRWWHQELADAQARLAVEKQVAAEREAELQARILALEQEIAGVRELEHALEVADRELAVTRRVMEDLTSSLSWRLTAPLRAAKRLLR